MAATRSPCPRPLVTIGVGQLVGSQVFREQNCAVRYLITTTTPRFNIAARVASDLPARHSLSAPSRCFLCDGVKFRWRDGFVRSASHSSAHNSSADFEGASFDVVDEASAFINLRAIWVILRERSEAKYLHWDQSGRIFYSTTLSSSSSPASIRLRRSISSWRASRCAWPSSTTSMETATDLP